MTESTREVGRFGEDRVAKELLLRGYKILKRNWRTPFGEVDLVVSKNNSLEILEVKTRLSQTNSSQPDELEPDRVLGFRQKARLTRAALWIWQNERDYYETFKFRLLIVTPHDIKFSTLPLLYDQT